MNEDAIKLAMVSLIREFKGPNQSDLDAALNVIRHHAATIQEQQDEINRLKAIIDSAYTDMQRP